MRSFRTGSWSVIKRIKNDDHLKVTWKDDDVFEVRVTAVNASTSNSSLVLMTYVEVVVVNHDCMMIESQDLSDIMY